MKRNLFWIIFIALLVFLAGSSSAAAPTVDKISTANNPLRTDANKVLKIKYRLPAKAIVNARIINNKRTVRIISRSRLLGRGYHVLKWNGRDVNRRIVPKGGYTVRITARRPGSKRVTVVNKRIGVINNLLFSEYFDRKDGLLADNYGRNDPLKEWKVTSQRLYVKSRLGYTASPVFRVITQKNNLKNYVMTANMKKLNRGKEAWEGLALFVRYQDANNLYIVSLRDDNKIHIKKKYRGNYTTLAMANINTNKLDYWYKLKVIAKGSNIQAFVDGIKYLDVDDATFSSGRVGIRTDNIKAYFDNFKVVTPPQTVSSSPSSEPETGGLLFSDYFDRPDGLIGNDSGSTDSQGKWKVTSYSFYAKDSQGYTDSPVFRAVTQKNDFSDFTLTTDMKKMDRGIEAWEGLALFIRYQDANNLYIVSLRDDDKVHIKKKHNGIYTTLAITPLSTNKLDSWYRVKVIALGNNIQIFVDDIKYIEINDSTFASGRVGIRTDNIEAYFDNYEVFSLQP